MTKSYSWWNTSHVQNVGLRSGSASVQTTEETGTAGDIDPAQQKKTEKKKKKEIVESGKVHLNMAEEKDLTSSSDMVNHPPHYTNSNIECIDSIKEALGDGYENYLQGVIIKYMWRYNHKGKPVEDLKKAQWYLEELIEIKQEK